MSELSPQARALLGNAAGADEPTDADRARIHAGIASKIVLAAGAGSSVAASSSAHAATRVAQGAGAAKAPLAVGAAKASLGKALATVCVIGGGVGVGTGVVALQGEENDSGLEGVAARSASASLVPPSRARRALATRVAEANLQVIPDRVLKDQKSEALAMVTAADEGAANKKNERPAPTRLANAASKPSTSARRSAPAPADVVTPPDASVKRGVAPAREASTGPNRAGDKALSLHQDKAADNGPDKLADLRDERRLINLARRSLRSRDSLAALESLKDHGKRFPRGVLAQERVALTVLALCERGRRDKARRLATSFFRRFPDSPMRSRIEASRCSPTKK